MDCFTYGCICCISLQCSREAPEHFSLTPDPQEQIRMVRDPPPQGCEYKILAWAVDPKPDATKRLKQSLLNFKVDHTYCFRGMTVRCLCSNPLEDPAAPDIQIRNLIYSHFDEALATTAPRLLVETVRKDRATLKMSQRKGKPEQEPLHAQLWRSWRNAQS